MATANLTRSETAHRSSIVTAHTSAVHLDLSGAPDASSNRFGVAAMLRFAATESQTWIDFIGHDVTRVEVNGSPIPVVWDGARISLTGLEAENTVVIEAVAHYSTSGEGLHRFVDPVDGETYLYTQYEPAESRRVMPCFEQPDRKFRYRFTVSAPEGWEVLSNQRVEHRSVDDGVQTVRFAETLPLSSYITAVAAGPYARVNGHWQREERRVELGVLCRASLAEHLDADEVIEITSQGLDFFTEAFGSDYPWGKYDQIFVPEYNLGAMENPGLVTFTESYVFRGASTTSQHESRANTILHEMAHMWFGDLVTMKWWDDLWLKESFADYMGSHASVAATRFTSAWVAFANRRKAWAYEQDQLPTTHPIVADIPDLEAAKLNFDGITYAKGASVLKQLVAFVGEEAFFAGARRYFRDHAYGNTTLADLLDALESASGRDLRGWSKAWLETTGMSTIHVEVAPGSLEITQTDPRPHTLSIGLWAWDAGRLVRRSFVDVTIDTERTTVDVPVISSADLVLPNDGDKTYAKVRLDHASVQAAAQGLSTIDDELARALVWSALWNATRDGELAASDYVEIARRHAPRERNVSLVAGVLANVQYALRNYVAREHRDRRAAEWMATAWQAMHDARPGSDEQLAWARGVGAAAVGDRSRAAELRAALRDEAAAPTGLRLDPDLRWSWMIALATNGDVSEAEIDAELARDATASGITAAIQARASLPRVEVRSEAWHRAFSDETLSNDHLDATIAGATAGEATSLLPDGADYFGRIGDVWRRRSIEIARRIVVGLYPARDDSGVIGGADWLSTHTDAPASLRRLVMERVDHAVRAQNARAADRPNLFA